MKPYGRLHPLAANKQPFLPSLHSRWNGFLGKKTYASYGIYFGNGVLGLHFCNAFNQFHAHTAVVVGAFPGVYSEFVVSVLGIQVSSGEPFPEFAVAMVGDIVPDVVDYVHCQRQICLLYTSDAADEL